MSEFYERFIVCKAIDAHARAKEDDVGAIITIEHKVPDFFAPQDWHGPRKLGKPQLVQTYFDIEGTEIPFVSAADSQFIPQRKHMEDARLFAHKFFATNRTQKLLIHCRSAKSRSTAVALMLLAEYHGPGFEHRAVEDLLRLQPNQTDPNRLLVKFADAILNRNSQLIAAVEAHPLLAQNREHHRLARERNFQKYWEMNPEKRPPGVSVDANGRLIKLQL